MPYGIPVYDERGHMPVRTILMKGPRRHRGPDSCFSQEMVTHTENFCKGGSGVTSGAKDILSVWEKSCVSGSLQSVCMEMGAFQGRTF